MVVLAFAINLLCSGCGTGMTVLALESPTISQVSPQVVTAGTPSVTVTVQGANFQSQAALTVNGTAVPTTVMNSTTIAANISGTALAQPAVAQLQVKNSNGGQSNQVPLTVTSAPDSGDSLSITTTQLPSGQVGIAYKVTLGATGGLTPYKWSVSSGSLPSGVALSSGGVISGTPTVSGTSTFGVTVTDAATKAQTKSVTYSITVAPQTAALGINSTALGTGVVGSSYAAQLSASGGTPSYTWSLASGSLPGGLALSSAGVISGTPTASGTFTFAVRAKDSGSPAQTASANESITVNAGSPNKLTITTTSLSATQTGSSYSASLSASGGTPGYTWSIASGSLPAGLALSSAGIISGTPTGSGTSTFTVGVKDSGSPAQTASASESITVSATPSKLTITTTSLAAGKSGSSYSASLSASGGTPGYTWVIASGSLPAGLTLSSTGVISGTPTGNGTSTFTVGVQDSGSPAQTASVSESITVSAAPSTLTITSTSLSAAQMGNSYSATLSANGGTPGYTWSVTAGKLPAGLSLSGGGVISGTPTGTNTGTSSFTVTVTDSASPAQTASAQESITVSTTPATLTVTSTSLAAGKSGSSYSATLSASGGTPGYAWSIASGSLPAGLTLSSAGAIAGTPTASGTATFTVAVKDNGSPVQTASAQESITVSAASSTLTITSTSLAAGKSGSSYSASLSASGGTPGYTWSIASGSLPAGLSLSSAGVISGTPTGSGNSTFTVAVQDSASPAQAASAQESITVSAASSTLTITTTSLAAGKNGSSYSASLTASGGTPGYTWSIASGSLPAGLSLSSAGVISGTPTGSGNSTFTVAVQDSASPAQTASASESITVSAAPSTLTITSTSLGAAQTGSSYSTTLSASGGTPGYTWSVSAGSLPAGLTMSSAGVISGTPTATGSSNFTVTVSDSASPAQTASAQESITVTAPQLTVTTVALGYGTTGSGYSATLNASGGTPSYTWSISQGSLPAGLTMSSAGVISGTPTANGTLTFTVSVADSASPAATASQQESITVTTHSSSGSGNAQLYVYPQTPVAPRGSYQTVTAVVTGVNDKTVTWTTDGGTIVGTNPCVVNEPCTVALYTTSTGTFHLTATSNANNSVAATSTITITQSPVAVTTHPRLLITASMLPDLRAKAVSSNPMYQSILTSAINAFNADNAVWSWSCNGGSGLPSSFQGGKEYDARLFAYMALVDPSDPTYNWGCYGRDTWVYAMNQVISGAEPIIGNTWSDTGVNFAVDTDWLMGSNSLSTADQTLARQFLAYLAQTVLGYYYGITPPVTGYNSPALAGNAIGNMRSMGNNYTMSKLMLMAAIGLTFNDTTGDDPALSNSCGATRYQVCSDYSAGSLHAYWSYFDGSMLYMDWAHVEDPNVSQQAYQSAYSNVPSPPTCLYTDGSSHPCFGDSRDGASSEGSWYQYSMYKLRYALNMMHTAGYDDPILYGPQVSLGTSSWWDLKYVNDLEFMTDMNAKNGPEACGTPSCVSPAYGYLTTGDSNTYYRTPADMYTEAAMMSADSYVGRTDRTPALEWMVLDTAYGGADGSQGGCNTWCGFDSGLSAVTAGPLAMDLMISLPASDPVSSVPSNPRPSLPTDIYNASYAQQLILRSGWTSNDTLFSFYCASALIDHEHENCGRFDIYSHGEYITKGRTEFDDYNEVMSTTPQSNEASYMNTTGSGCGQGCLVYPAVEYGGEFTHGQQQGIVSSLVHSELAAYAAITVDDTPAYNGWWVYSSPYDVSSYNDVQHASRDVLFLRGSNQVVFYDRGVTGSASDKSVSLITTGATSVNANTASWPTQSGTQTAYYTALLPTQGSLSNAGLLPANSLQVSDWEPVSSIREDAGAVSTAQFLSVLQWGSSSSAPSSATLVQSTSGQNFDGALVGSSLTMFMRTWPASFTGVVYPASGATTQYVSDLTPNTTYSITGAGAPATATTDTAGVLTFSAAGTGSITVAPSH